MNEEEFEEILKTLGAPLIAYPVLLFLTSLFNLVLFRRIELSLFVLMLYGVPVLMTGLPFSIEYDNFMLKIVGTVVMFIDIIVVLVVWRNIFPGSITTSQVRTIMILMLIASLIFFAIFSIDEGEGDRSPQEFMQMAAEDNQTGTGQKLNDESA